MRNEELYTAIIKGKRKNVELIVNAALQQGEDVSMILTDSMIPAMRDLGEKFSRNEVYVPEMLVAARAMQTALNIIEPILANAGHKSLGKVCIGTVKGDQHDIGKNLVAIMLKGAGYTVVDLGVDCDIDRYVAAVDNGVDIVLLSALLTTTMPYMKEIIDTFKDRPNVKVVVGGAPITRDYADSIGAHGYGEDAYAAVGVIKNLLNL